MKVISLGHPTLALAFTLLNATCVQFRSRSRQSAKNVHGRIQNMHGRIRRARVGVEKNLNILPLYLFTSGHVLPHSGHGLGQHEHGMLEPLFKTTFR